MAAQKAKARAIASKFAPPSALNAQASATPPPSDTNTPPAASEVAPAPAPKTSIADWTASADDDDVNQFYIEKAQRGGRKKRKKNNQQKEIVQDWDDIYDPSRPNSYEEYKNSEEKIREVRDWKDKLYAHRMRRRQTSDYDSGESDQRPAMNSMYFPFEPVAVLTRGPEQFAPPASMSFAPPSNLKVESSPQPSRPADPPDDPTGEDAYSRRMRLSQQHTAQHPPPAPPPIALPGQITAAPIRYQAPPPLPDDSASEPEHTPDTDAPRSSRPGQAGFAERLLSKYGWTKGSGLGAQGTGIINPLYAKVDKRKKKPDSEGGGFVTPSTTARIMGGSKSRAAKEEDVGKFGAMSEVVRLRGMLRGLDVEEEIARGEGGGLMQEIGEECGGKYGAVERVFVNRGEEQGEEGPMVFIQFVSPLSALRAVNALEGRVFGGNVIVASFWPKEDFEGGRYGDSEGRSR